MKDNTINNFKPLKKEIKALENGKTSIAHRWIELACEDNHLPKLFTDLTQSQSKFSSSWVRKNYPNINMEIQKTTDR